MCGTLRATQRAAQISTCSSTLSDKPLTWPVELAKATHVNQQRSLNATKSRHYQQFQCNLGVDLCLTVVRSDFNREVIIVAASFMLQHVSGKIYCTWCEEPSGVWKHSIVVPDITCPYDTGPLPSPSDSLPMLERKGT